MVEIAIDQLAPFRLGPGNRSARNIARQGRISLTDQERAVAMSYVDLTRYDSSANIVQKKLGQDEELRGLSSILQVRPLPA